jgi:energy-coupling factor transport system substrate-specific component
MNGFRKEFTTFSVALIPVAIALNIAAGTAVVRAGIPLYLDSIGTVLVGVLVGPWAGAVTGFLANMIWTVSGLYVPSFAFAGVAAAIGALAGIFARSGWFKEWWRAGLAGILTGVVAALVSAPIAAYVFGGALGAGTDALVALYRAAGLDALGANVAQGITSDPLDKLLTFEVVWILLLALPQRFKARFGNNEPAALAKASTGKPKKATRRKQR